MIRTNKPMSDGGKGSVRRNEDTEAYRNNYDNIFRKKKTMMNDDPQERSDEDYERSEDDYVDETDVEECPVCRGQLVLTGTKMYLFCDTCGHREEVDHDYD